MINYIYWQTNTDINQINNISSSKHCTHWLGVHQATDKPGSVLDSHSSGHYITVALKRPTRILSEQRHRILFGLAPNGVWPATRCYQRHGALLPHHFTLTCAVVSHSHRRLCFLFHFPSPHDARLLAGILLCGARTFLHAYRNAQRLSGLLMYRSLFYHISPHQQFYITEVV